MKFPYISAILALLVMLPAFSYGQRRDVSVQTGGAWLTSIGHRTLFSSPDIASGSVLVDFRSRKGNPFNDAFNNPSFGIGFSFLDQSSAKLVEPDHLLGDVYALYGTMRRDVFRAGKFDFGYDLAFGGAYTSRIFDNYENEWNWFFGSHFTFYAQGGAHVAFHVTPHFQVIAQAQAMHASNARLAYPNFGLNFAGAGLAAKYSFNPDWHGSGNGRIPDSAYHKGLVYDIQFSGGVHHCGTEWVAKSRTLAPDDRSLHAWPKASLSLDVMYRWCGRVSSGAMVDCFWSSNARKLKEYDTVIYGQEEVGSCEGYDPFSFGVGMINNIHFRSFAISHSVGRYLYRRMGIRDDHGDWYQKAGIRWFCPGTRLFLGACCKAQLFKAEYLELSVGYRLGSR